MWLIYPRNLWHYWILTLLQLLDLCTLPLLAVVLLVQHHKPQAYAGWVASACLCKVHAPLLYPSPSMAPSPSPARMVQAASFSLCL
jgi:hypothetical protein